MKHRVHSSGDRGSIGHFGLLTVSLHTCSGESHCYRARNLGKVPHLVDFSPYPEILTSPLSEQTTGPDNPCVISILSKQICKSNSLGFSKRDQCYLSATFRWQNRGKIIVKTRHNITLEVNDFIHPASAICFTVNNCATDFCVNTCSRASSMVVAHPSNSSST